MKIARDLYVDPITHLAVAYSSIYTGKVLSARVLRLYSIYPTFHLLLHTFVRVVVRCPPHGPKISPTVRMVVAVREMQADLTKGAVKEEEKRSVSRNPSPTPNYGSAVPDHEAMADSEPADTWRARCGIDPTKQVKLVKLAHMRYQHPDLEEISTFLKDFGMHITKKTDDKIWYRGYGPDQYVYYAEKGPKKFLGGAFEVESYEELEKYDFRVCDIPQADQHRASKIEGAGAITKLHGPGGGSMLSLVDPEGFPLNLVYGITPADTGDMPQKIIYNTESEKPRQRHFSRFKPGPAAVHKLGMLVSLPPSCY